jgi:hypothetical protein
MGSVPIFPVIDRDLEERLVALCLERGLEPKQCLAAGPPYFIAGVLVTAASVLDAERPRLLALAEALHPGISEAPVYGGWLEHSPLRPARFVPRLKRQARLGV